MFGEILRIAFGSLVGNKFRSILTVLSVTIGAFAIVVMMSLAESGSKTLARSVEEIGGARLVWWVPNPPRDARERGLYAKGLTREDVLALRTLPFVNIVTAMSVFDQQTLYRSAAEPVKADVVAMLDGLLEGLTWDMEEGRRFLPREVDQLARVCILTDGLAHTLFASRTPIGERITLNGKPYQVIGVLKKRKMMMNVGLGFDWDNSAFIPMATAEKREGLIRGGMAVVAFTTDEKHNRDVVGLGSARLLGRHNGVADFLAIDFGEIIGSFQEFFRIVSLIVGLIAGISLIAGGIGVMNIMLVSIAERVKEIGIRKTLGASIPAIFLQFVGEATVLSCAGGAFGVLSGLFLTFIAHLALGQWSEFWIAHYSMLGISLALGVTGGIGIVFGALPATYAARLDIVECLRR